MTVGCDKRQQDKVCCVDCNCTLEKIKNLKVIEFCPCKFEEAYPCIKKWNNNCHIYAFDDDSVKENLPNCVALQTCNVHDKPFLKRKLTNLVWEPDYTREEYRVKIPGIIWDDTTTGVCQFFVKKEDQPDNYCIIKDMTRDELNLKVEDDKETFFFPEKYEYVYLYGIEINNFTTLDSEQIIPLHNIGISKLLCENDSLKETVSSLTSRLETLEKAFLNK